MSKHDLQMAYLQAMTHWMREESNTRTMMMSKNVNGFKGQQEREEAAYKVYREAMYAFVIGPNDSVD